MKWDGFLLWGQQLRKWRSKQVSDESQSPFFSLEPQILLEGGAKGIDIYYLIFLLIKWFFIVKIELDS